MTVELLTHTPDPLRLMYTAARGTTTSRGFAAVYAEPQRFFPKALRDLDPLPEDASTEIQRLVTEALTAGHWSISRGVHLTFAITCSRNTSKQLMRQVIGVAHEEMSQRYVKLLNHEYLRAFKWQINVTLVNSECAPADRAATWAYLLELAGQLFEVPEHIATRGPDDLLVWDWFHTRTAEIEQYLDEVAAGAPLEEARDNLPGAALTQVLSTFSFEALHNFLAKRLCTRAQTPIRKLATQMRRQTMEALGGWTGPFLAIQCIPMGICPESRPDGCALLRENGGNIVRAADARTILKKAVQS